ncbi:hypothetical protein BIW11_02964 [Tropilaelaps mercedesae]|uniref:Protein kinase domain-containing protein n=1 Tax=Tropilaelaps mercedesae TaxID=418985 RepID=A0A1V9XUG9_9ACAR|nr:hypothetical protein BIW11_02964 [Tropilaelaps mercedesae]
MGNALLRERADRTKRSDCRCALLPGWFGLEDDYNEKIRPGIVAALKRRINQNIAHVTTKQISDYKITGIIGGGSFAQAFRATHRSGRLSALKAVRKDYNNFVEIISEVTTLKQLYHPFITHFYHTAETDRFYFIDAEFAPMGSMVHMLGNPLRPGELVKLSESTTCFYIAQLVLALEYIHTVGLVHRDIKPDNIVVDVTGYIKLCNFRGVNYLPTLPKGMARNFFGTNGYMPPEVILNQCFMTGPDWFATGVTLFELLTGNHLFDSTEHLLDNCQDGLGFLTAMLQHHHVNVSDACFDLMVQLTEYNQWLRLGCMRGGVEDVKRHEWFAHVNWASLYRKKYVCPLFVEQVHLGRINPDVIEKFERADTNQDDALEQLREQYEEQQRLQHEQQQKQLRQQQKQQQLQQQQQQLREPAQQLQIQQCMQRIRQQLQQEQMQQDGIRQQLKQLAHFAYQAQQNLREIQQLQQQPESQEQLQGLQQQKEQLEQWLQQYPQIEQELQEQLQQHIGQQEQLGQQLQQSQDVAALREQERHYSLQQQKHYQQGQQQTSRERGQQLQRQIESISEQLKQQEVQQDQIEERLEKHVHIRKMMEQRMQELQHLQQQTGSQQQLRKLQQQKEQLEQRLQQSPQVEQQLRQQLQQTTEQQQQLVKQTEQLQNQLQEILEGRG